MGFLDEFEDKKTLEVYSLGTPVLKMSFDDYVCLDSGCIAKKQFIDKYISEGLYDKLLDDILAKRRLKIGSSYQNTNDGFVQTAKDGNNYDIKYTVKNKSVEFVEKIHGFRFLIRFVDGE